MFNLQKTLEILLPRGRFFENIGKRMHALIKSIASQFETSIEYLEKMAFQKQIAENIDFFAQEYNLDITGFKQEKALEMLLFLKYMPLNISQKDFFDTLKYLFPGISSVKTLSSLLNYQNAQIGTYMLGDSQLSGLKTRYDVVHVAGTVQTFFEKRLLIWFLERFGRTKLKFELDMKVLQSTKEAMCGIAEIGTLLLGGFFKNG